MIYLLIAALGWLAIIWFAQRPMLFPRWAIADPGLADPGPDAEVIHLETDAGPVEAWFIPGQGADADHPAPVVIFAHGNGELIDHWPAELRGYSRLGVGVLLAEFRGYGRSAGSPSQEAIVSDYVAFYDQLAQRPDVDASRIVLHGRSVGGGIVAQLAAQRPAVAMILQSSFTGTAPMARRYLVPRFLVRDPLDVTAVLQQYRSPVLILHGDRDRIIPPGHAKQNHAAAPDSRLIFYDMGHNDPPPARRFWADIEAFLREVGILDYNADDPLTQEGSQP